MNLRPLIIALPLALSGCASLKQVPGQQFVQEYCQGAFGQNSAWSSSFVGHGHDRTYLEYWSAKPAIFGGGKRVHWARTAELPPSFSGATAPSRAEVCGQS
jgi:hypothetical protein